MARLSDSLGDFTFYLFGCMGCGIMASVDLKQAPCCVDPDCPKFGEAMTPLHEIVKRIEGEGWKY